MGEVSPRLLLVSLCYFLPVLLRRLAVKGVKNSRLNSEVRRYNFNIDLRVDQDRSL
jgi:hypothetical protein